MAQWLGSLQKCGFNPGQCSQLKDPMLPGPWLEFSPWPVELPAACAAIEKKKKEKKRKKEKRIYVLQTKKKKKDS